MLRRKWMLLFVICCMCLGAGCSKTEPQDKTGETIEGNGEWGKRENPFEETGKQEEETEAGSEVSGDEKEGTQEEKETEAIELGWLRCGFRNVHIGEGLDGKYVYYDGGELSFDYVIATAGLEESGLGLMVFVDGIPQEYRITMEEKYIDLLTYPVDKGEGEEYSDSHTIYPEGLQEIYFTVHFTPTVGTAGETLELVTILTIAPDYCREKGSADGLDWRSDKSEASLRIIYNESVPENNRTGENTENNVVKMNHVQTVMKEMTYEQKLAYEDKWNWTSKNWIADSNCVIYLDDQDITLGNSYDASGKDTVHLRVELVGAGQMQYRAVVYLGKELLSAEALMETQDGMITIMEADIDVAGYEGAENLVVMLIPLNNVRLVGRIDLWVRLLTNDATAFYR